MNVMRRTESLKIDDEIIRDVRSKLRRLLISLFLSKDLPGAETVIDEAVTKLVAGIKTGIVTAYEIGYRAGLAEIDSSEGQSLH